MLRGRHVIRRVVGQRDVGLDDRHDRSPHLRERRLARHASLVTRDDVSQLRARDRGERADFAVTCHYGSSIKCPPFSCRRNPPSSFCNQKITMPALGVPSPSKCTVFVAFLPTPPSAIFPSFTQHVP